MGSFAASLKTIGDRRGLPATIRVDDGRLSIAMGDQPLGDWGLDEIRLEPIPNGYRMAAEGDQILLEMEDTAAFEDALSQSGTKSRRRRAKTRVNGTAQVTTKTPKPEKKRKKRERRNPAPASTPVSVAPEATAPKPEKKPSTPLSARFLASVDAGLAVARHRWGSLLPDWVFTRGMLAALFVLLVLTIIFPGWISTLLLIIGVLVVMFGAVLYTDSVLASRWLPGRMTPMHVLISGVGTLLIGVIVGIIAN